MTPTASLPMYNLPEMRAVNARFWEALRGLLLEAGLRDLPDRYESFILEHGGPGPFGAKGIGEAGMLGVASAIANAIHDAVGARLTEIPFTPERVLAAIEASV